MRNATFGVVKSEPTAHGMRRVYLDATGSWTEDKASAHRTTYGRAAEKARRTGGGIVHFA